MFSLYFEDLAFVEFFTGDAMEMLEKLSRDERYALKYRLLVTSPPISDSDTTAAAFAK